MLRLLQDKLPSKDVNWLTEICRVRSATTKT
jgi:hypothetical protein